MFDRCAIKLVLVVCMSTLSEAACRLPGNAILGVSMLLCGLGMLLVPVVHNLVLLGKLRCFVYVCAMRLPVLISQIVLPALAVSTSGLVRNPPPSSFPPPTSLLSHGRQTLCSWL